MPYRRRRLATLAAVTALLAARPAAAELLFTPTDGGRTFRYSARPGDTPTAVATMFGLPPEELPAFLADNGIADPTRVGAGFVYRVPNVAARGLAERAARLEQEVGRLGAALAAEQARTLALTREVEQARSGAAVAEERAARLGRVATLWPLLQALVVLLALGAAAGAVVATAALRRREQAARYAQALAAELDEKRRAVLAQRQESARRILDLEGRVRSLEAQLGPRLLVGGRGS
jgi:hypothetical protein